MILKTLLIAFVLFATPVFAQSTEVKQMHTQMLLPAVQVDAGNSTGSGTVIFSQTGRGTYVLTNHHVIATAITFIDEYDPSRQQTVKREKRNPVTVRFHTYADGSRYTGSDNRLAYIEGYDATADLAVLRLDDTEHVVPNVAAMSPVNARLDRGERVWAVGAGLGNPPFITEGIIGYIGYRIDTYPYIMATAPIIFGNSGGALYRKNAEGNYELIGVPSRVAIQGNFFASSAVSHIGWHIELSTVRNFLERNKLSFITK